MDSKSLFDVFHDQLSELRQEVEGKDTVTVFVSDELRRLSNLHAQILEEQRRRNESDRPLMAALHAHRWHKDFLMKSSFIKLALTKPRGYAGDASLMRKICLDTPLGDTAFDRLIDRFYLDLPAAQAVRDRKNALFAKLASLPDGATVLNLACGPALEVRDFLTRYPDRNVRFVLLDHDIQTIQEIADLATDHRCQVGLANAFQITKGNLDVELFVHLDMNLANDQVVPVASVGAKTAGFGIANLGAVRRFDLVYTSGLFDYIKRTSGNLQRGVTGLTARLFDLVADGGELIVGNFRKPGASGNPHQIHHKMMMDLYSDWYLLYRSDEEILGFADTISKASADIKLLGESLASLEFGGAIAFLSAKRLW